MVAYFNRSDIPLDEERLIITSLTPTDEEDEDRLAVEKALVCPECQLDIEEPDSMENHFQVCHPVCAKML